MEGTERRERAEQYAVVGQAVALYARLAETGERQQIFRDLTAIELKHAAHWNPRGGMWPDLPQGGWGRLRVSSRSNE